MVPSTCALSAVSSAARRAVALCEGGSSVDYQATHNFDMR
jgi:hypothetical protein